MERKRPAALTTIAVLNIVFGSLGLICSCFYSLGIGVLMTASPNNPNEKIAELARAAELLKGEIPSLLPVEISVALYSLVFSVLLVVAGIGLLYIANWARILCFIFAIMTILTQVAFLLYTFLVRFPGMARIQGVGPVASHPIEILRLVAIVLIIIFSIVLIIVLCSRTITEAYSPRTIGEEWEQAYEGHEGYDEYHSDRG
jgi:hypothetical protein